ncbi:MAG: acetate--CoA ligase family protein [Deltaproteobacteria bacterium]|nr:acetate--CoA ligase family protein [Deltaproteobacteria bacterium]
MSLDALFRPESIVVVGASRKPEKVGYGVFANLVQAGFQGEVLGVNPSGGEISGKPVYPSIKEIPGKVDLGVFVVPPDAVIDGIPLLAAKGMRAAIVISAGFKEVGGAGAGRERELRDVARNASVRVLGPNCLGLINTHARLNASFSAGTPPSGAISFFSQSGALCTAILDWAIGENVGFSKFVSLGNQADISQSDVMEYLANDPDTRVILGYVESIEDGMRFLRVSREVTARKPVILVKAGSTAAGARAASSHTGSLAGSDRAYSAAFRQGGILRAETVEDLFDLALGFAMQPMPRGDRLLILTNAGGPGILAADTAEKLGIRLAEVSPELRSRLAARMPATASLGNPVDIIGDAQADRYRDALSEIRNDPSLDAVLVLLTPQAMTEPEGTARAAVRALADSGKTAFASFLGESSVREARKILSEGGIPQYPVPERAVRSFQAMLRYVRIRGGSPQSEAAPGGIRTAQARTALDAALAKGRKTLGEEESREILSAYGFWFPRHVLAQTSEEAVRASEEMRRPVAMKIVSPDILHKTDVGGVRLNLTDREAVADAFVEITSSARRMVPEAWISGVSVQEMVSGGRELILGMSRDPQFGPLLMFGLGGIYVEVLKDVSFRLAPLSRDEAVEMVREIRAYPLLSSFRGSLPADEGGIVDALLRISRLSMDFPEIQELDINPADPVLESVSVKALAEALGAETAYGEDRMETLIERFCVGAMDMDGALRVFRRVPRKAVITGGHRTDIQLAALETDTRCLVLTGGVRPNDLILARAREKGVPILVVQEDTLFAVEKFENLLGRLRIREAEKIRRGVDLVRENVDVPGILEALRKGGTGRR